MNIGYYYPVDPVYSKRDGRSDYSSKNLPYDGLKKIVSEIDGHRVFPIYKYSDMKNADIILVSMVSFYDVIELKKIHDRKDNKVKIIIGGPACNNIRGYLDFIDVACFGRCDNGDINKIINGIDLPNVWRKQNDKNFELNYTVGIATPYSMSHKEPGLFGEIETKITDSVGCPMRCAFCHYGHFNKFVTSKNDNSYSSGVSKYEDFFTKLDWAKCARGGVTALDGGTEETRIAVGKNIKYSDLIDKLLSVESSPYDGLHRFKCYNIYGYPWENQESYILDLFNAAIECDNKINKRILIKMQASHFIPFVATPMENLSFNIKPFNVKFKEFKYVGKNIQIFPGTHNQSPRISLLSTMIQRSNHQLPDQFFTKKTYTMDIEKLMKFCKSIDIDIGQIKNHPASNIKSFKKKYDMENIYKLIHKSTGMEAGYLE